MDWLEAWLPYIFVPALVMSLLAQLFVQFVLVRAETVDTRISGYAVARHVLDGAGQYEVQVEQVPGPFSEHFETHRNLLQLSHEIYHGRNIATMAVAAHEACHALQNAGRNRWLVIRDLAVPAASFGSGAGILVAVVGLVTRAQPLLAWGVVLFSVTVYLQLLNLPIELHASYVAQRRLVGLGMVDQEKLPRVRLALFAMAFTYVGATLQSVFTLVQRVAWLLSRPGGRL
ncbi:MAG: zinc metallopeptidase [Planctomycetota bacterium]